LSVVTICVAFNEGLALKESSDQILVLLLLTGNSFTISLTIASRALGLEK
jgi:hypothetical protein